MIQFEIDNEVNYIKCNYFTINYISVLIKQFVLM